MTTPPATTPSQTVGPFFAIPGGLLWPDGPDVVPEGTPSAVVLRGRVLDGNGDIVPDAMVETWQADEHGAFARDPRGGRSSFRGLGRCGTDTEGRYWIRTVKPGGLPTPDGATEAPHIDVSVLARGLLNRLVTRIYFPDEETANAADPVLSAVDPRRRATLIAEPSEDGLRFDIRLQGDDETIFFTV